MPARGMLQVDVINAVGAPVTTAEIRSVISRAAKLPEIEARLRATRSTLAVRLTDDTELRRLHREYSRSDRATDVLSFEGAGDHLGDLAISWDAVVRQAGRYRHPPSTELALLCVHGLLHLLGWDHVTGPQRREMTRVTVAALIRSGIELGAGRL